MNENMVDLRKRRLESLDNVQKDTLIVLLSENLIRTISARYRFYNTVFVDLSCNSLKTFGDLFKIFPNVEVLHARQNLLYEVYFPARSRLVFVDLSGNQLSRIHAFPEGLYCLNLSGNCLKAFFMNSDAILECDVSCNQISACRVVSESLQYLHMQRNFIDSAAKFLPMLQMRYLRFLNVADNVCTQQIAYCKEQVLAQFGQVVHGHYHNELVIDIGLPQNVVFREDSARDVQFAEQQRFISKAKYTIAHRFGLQHYFMDSFSIAKLPALNAPKENDSRLPEQTVNITAAYTVGYQPNSVLLQPRIPENDIMAQKAVQLKAYLISHFYDEKRYHGVIFYFVQPWIYLAPVNGVTQTIIDGLLYKIAFCESNPKMSYYYRIFYAYFAASYSLYFFNISYTTLSQEQGSLDFQSVLDRMRERQVDVFTLPELTCCRGKMQVDRFDGRSIEEHFCIKSLELYCCDISYLKLDSNIDLYGSVEAMTLVDCGIRKVFYTMFLMQFSALYHLMLYDDVIFDDLPLLYTILGGCHSLYSFNYHKIEHRADMSCFDFSLEEKLAQRVFYKGFEVGDVDKPNMALFE